MHWTEIRQQYPDQWLVIDALKAHTEENRRKLDQMTVVEICPDGATAYERYRELHQQHPEREFYFVHTSREELESAREHWFHSSYGAKNASSLHDDFMTIIGAASVCWWKSMGLHFSYRRERLSIMLHNTTNRSVLTFDSLPRAPLACEYVFIDAQLALHFSQPKKTADSERCHS